MSAEANKALVRRFVEEIMSGGNPHALDDPGTVDEMVAPDALHHEFTRSTNYRTTLRRVFGQPERAQHFVIEHLLADGDLVAARGTFSSTSPPEGELFHGLFPARPGVRADAPHAHFFRIRDGRIVEHWAIRDDLEAALQLGAFADQPPAGEGAGGSGPAPDR
jgi:predicted ester cyclase